MGRTEALTTISRKNTASIGSYQRFGARPQKTLYYFSSLQRTVGVRMLRRNLESR